MVYNVFNKNISNTNKETGVNNDGVSEKNELDR